VEFLTHEQIHQAFEIAIFKTQRKYYCSNLRVMTVYNARTKKREYFCTNNQIVFSTGGPVYECWLPYKYQSTQADLIKYLKDLLGSYVARFDRATRLKINNRYIDVIDSGLWQF
jgi:hypothetical protein